jgi:hypothetical protein
MTIHTGSIAQKREFFGGLIQRAAEAAKRLRADLISAREYTNPDMSDAATTAERGRREERARLSAEDEAATQRREAADALGYLDRVLDTERPRITDYARAQASWQQAKMYLDNGHTLHHVLSNADLALALAVEEFGPHHLRSLRDPSKVWQTRFDIAPHANATEAAVAELQAAVLRRFAAVTTDPALADLITVRLSADPAMVGAAAWWDGLDAVAAGRAFNGLNAAVQARLAEQQLAAQLVDATAQAARG